MRMNVNPNRMELLKIKRRLVIARRGHKLLKDKQEELVRQFLILIKQIRARRLDLENKLPAVYRNFVFATAAQSKTVTDYKVLSSNQKFGIEKKQKMFMNIPVAEFSYQFVPDNIDYEFSGTSAKMDMVFNSAKETLPHLLKLAREEKQLLSMASEIERTRRRVNALEYIFIPGLLETIKYIAMKMGELERDALTRLMKVKDIVRSH